jgi:hypothetical protein
MRARYYGSRQELQKDVQEERDKAKARYVKRKKTLSKMSKGRAVNQKRFSSFFG